MSNRHLAFIILSLMLTVLVGQRAHAAGLTAVGWSGRDFVLTFADSAAYSIDLVASDSSQLVIRFDGSDATPALIREHAGPDGRRAVLTRASDGVLRLTIIDPVRLGYSTEWQAYTHRLVVHTFSWASLQYPEEQFHKGLLALDQKVYEQAEELLDVAYATGNEHAGTVLGSYYARQGKDSLATHYLKNQTEPEALAAQADLARRHGDNATANSFEQQANERLAQSTPTTSAQTPDTTATPSSERRSSTGLLSLADPRVIAIGLGVLVLLIAAVTWAIRRGAKLEHAKAERTARPTPEPTPIVTPEAPVIPVTEAPPPVTPSTPSEPAQTEPTPSTPAETVEVIAEVPEAEATSTEHVETPAEAPAVEVVEEKVVEQEVVSTAPEVEASPEPVVEATPHEALRDPELAPHAAEEASTGAFVRHTGETPEPQPKRILSVQARELQRKIQSRRPDHPAPSEPTKSAARRLNISRDNVELRRMMEQATKKPEEKK